MNATNKIGIIQVTVTGIVHSLGLSVAFCISFVWIWDRNINYYHYGVFRIIGYEYMIGHGIDNIRCMMNGCMLYTLFCPAIPVQLTLWQSDPTLAGDV